MTAIQVIVVGSGFAGVAAAWAARRAGADVTVVMGGVGASSLYAGAADDETWDEMERAARLLHAPVTAAPLGDLEEEFARDLALWTVPGIGEPLPRIVTTAGVVRSARAHDRALLDLAKVEGRAILVPRADRAGWDADSLVRCLREPETRLSRATTFEAIPAPVLRFDEERDIVDIDLAARHDDDGRLDWLAGVLMPEIERRGRTNVAVLVGPWLGAARARAADLSRRLGVPVGEALAATAGTAGHRFEVRRSRFLSENGVHLVSGWAAAANGGAVMVDTMNEPLGADAVVLAMGGLIGGGIRYEPPEHGASAEGPKLVRPSLKLGLRADGVRVVVGKDAGVTSSALGPSLDERAWPVGDVEGVLERAGVLVRDHGRAAPMLFAAGDLAFGARRTVLLAVRSGLAAGRAAAEEAALALQPATHIRSSRP